MTKKGYIVKINEDWVVAESYNPDVKITDPKRITPLHPAHISTVIDGDTVKPECQGEVEYELEYGKKWDTNTYAIPIISDKVDVWEEAEKQANEYADKQQPHIHDRSDMNDWWMSKLDYLKQHYQLTQTNP